MSSIPLYQFHRLTIIDPLLIYKKFHLQITVHNLGQTSHEKLHEVRSLNCHQKRHVTYTEKEVALFPVIYSHKDNLAHQRKTNARLKAVIVIVHSNKES